MTTPTCRELEARLADLREDTDAGFYAFKVGPNTSDDGRTGFYQWDDRRECYVNEHGYTPPVNTAPNSKFDYNVEYE